MSTAQIVTLIGATAVILFCVWVVARTYNKAMDDWQAEQDRLDGIGRGTLPADKE